MFTPSRIAVMECSIGAIRLLGSSWIGQNLLFPWDPPNKFGYQAAPLRDDVDAEILFLWKLQPKRKIRSNIGFNPADPPQITAIFWHHDFTSAVFLRASRAIFVTQIITTIVAARPRLTKVQYCPPCFIASPPAADTAAFPAVPMKT